MSTALSHQKTFSNRQVLASLYAAAVAFLTYASVYAYRKPFTVATFDDHKFWGISYQTLLIISQVVGYMLSKFYGIRFIAELKRLGRWKTILILMSIAWGALLFFALTPPPYGMIFFFAGFCISLYLIVAKLARENFGLTDKPLFYIGLAVMIIGMQLFLTGFLTELIVRNAPDRNNYLIEKKVGII